MPKRSKTLNYHCIRNAAGDGAEIMIFDDIGAFFFGGGITAEMIDEDLKGLGRVDEITVRINSAGGSVMEATAIHTMLVQNRAQIRVQVEGIAASAAAMIAMAGDTIAIAEAGFLMIHDPLMLTMGNADDHRASIDVLEKFESSIRGVFVDRSGLDEDEVDALMAAETWFTASEAVEKGFADEILENLKVAAYADTRPYGFRHPPTPLAEPTVTQINAYTRQRIAKYAANAAEHQRLLNQSRVA